VNKYLGKLILMARGANKDACMIRDFMVCYVESKQTTSEADSIRETMAFEP
jgi:hypothetical protein